MTIEDVVRVARETAKVGIPEEVKKRVKRSREVLEKLVTEDQVIYGVNTGFGALSSIRISRGEIGQLQSNLIRSHSSGVGEPLSTEIVRALMLLRTNTLAKGYSGIRLENLESIVEILNKVVYHIIPAKSSVCASGDLAPISHDSGAYGRRQSDYRKRGYTTEYTSWLFQSRLAAENLKRKELCEHKVCQHCPGKAVLHKS